MNTANLPPSPRQRAAEMFEVLRVWANALGCTPQQVTDVVAKAGLPMEKLWNSIDAGFTFRRVS
jgi:hypothetical protein